MQGDAEDLPFPTDSFDRYVSAGSIEYWPEPQRGIKEAYRCSSIPMHSVNREHILESTIIILQCCTRHDNLFSLIAKECDLFMSLRDHRLHILLSCGHSMVEPRAYPELEHPCSYLCLLRGK